MATGTIKTFENRLEVKIITMPTEPSISSSGIYNKTIDISYDGYEAIGIVGVDVSGTNVSRMNIYEWYITGADNTLTVKAFNTGSSNVTSYYLEVHVLYRKL